MKMDVNLGYKFLTGVGSAGLATWLTTFDGATHVVAVILTILVSIFTLLNLMWSFVNKLHKGSLTVEKDTK